MFLASYTSIYIFCGVEKGGSFTFFFEESKMQQQAKRKEINTTGGWKSSTSLFVWLVADGWC
jgi:hypothetical protein